MANTTDGMRETGGKALVGIVMGSDSDLQVMSKAADMLEELGIGYEMRIISAHREPDVLVEWAGSAQDKGIRVIIAGAGMAAALPGMCAALSVLPVIAVPLSGQIWTVWTRYFPLCRCPPVFRWLRWPLTERRTGPFWRQRFWDYRIRSCRPD